MEALEHPAHGVLDRLQDAADAEDRCSATITRSPPRPSTTGCSAAGASPPCTSPSRARTCAARRSRTASSSGGTCTSRRARRRRTCSGTRRRARCRQRRRRRTAHGAAGLDGSLRVSLLEHLVDALGEPLVAACLRGLGQARPHDEHVVVVTGTVSASSFARQISRSLRLIRLRTTALPAAFGTASPRRGSPARPRARTSTGSESGSKSSGRAGRRRRSRGSGRGGSSAARGRPGLGRQALAPLGAAALEDHAAGARRHARAEAVLALPPAYVWLIGPFHSHWKERRNRDFRGNRAASIDGPPRPKLSTGSARRKSRGKARSQRVGEHFPHLWRHVWRNGFSLQNSVFCHGRAGEVL